MICLSAYEEPRGIMGLRNSKGQASPSLNWNRGKPPCSTSMNKGLKVGPLPSPSIVQHNRCRVKDDITFKGQIWDGRDLKPHTFVLTCPRCRADKESAKCTLYTRCQSVILHQMQTQHEQHEMAMQPWYSLVGLPCT